MDNGIVKDSDIPGCNDRSLDPCTAADDGTPAIDTEGDTRSRTQFEPATDIEPSPEMGVCRHDEIPVDLHIAVKIRPFFCKERIALPDQFRHFLLMVVEAGGRDKPVA